MKTHHTITLGLALATALSIAGCSDTADPAVAEELLSVAEQGDLTTLNRLLARTPGPDVRDSCDWTPLMKAALYGHDDVVARLLEAGAHVDAIDKGGYTAMLLAASNNHAQVVDLLLKHGAMIDHQEATKGWTALIWAAKQGHAKTVQTLLAHGADATLRDADGKTAADWAREENRAEILSLIQTRA